MKKILNMLVIVLLVLPWYNIPDATAQDPAMPTIGDYSASPIFTVATAPPMVMLVMGRDHKLYYEAYNDASDLNGDGTLDVGYNPSIDYYGYFDSYKCYDYSSSNNRFEPASVTSDKTCTNKWSGDFLNYITMSRMDTMRKVLYGGYRFTDTATETVLERAYIPQDAHSWGKEYESIEKDGYDIREYTPLNLPAPMTRHLFANTTLSDGGAPLMRILNDTVYRIWEWVAIERPVAGTRCLDGASGPNCATSGGEIWEIVPASVFESLTQTTYDITGMSTHPVNHSEFNTLQSTYGTEPNKFGSGPVSNINGSGNPFGSDNYYMTIFEGQINIPSTGTYEFAVDGDDAIELIINGTVVASWYDGHGKCDCQTHNGTIYLEKGQHDIVFRHEEIEGSDNYYLYWKRVVPSSAITDYVVRVKVGVTSMPEANCKQYGGESGPYKPVGVLQRHGETDKMYFGLMTGSYAKNMSGGVIRKNVASIKDEINPDSGQFTSVNGIIKTIDKMKIVNFRYSDHSYYPGWSGAWIANRPMNEGEFPDWGNPIGEMMYETLRYFADGGSATSEYNYSGSTKDSALGLPKPAWEDPFMQPDDDDEMQNLYCAKPIMLVISDINPSFDSDQLPGSAFAASGWGGGQVLGEDTLHVQNRLNEISDDVEGLHFIGQVGSDYDSSCSPKEVDGLGNVRGICPEEPTKRGSYYSGAVAHYGRNTDLRTDLPGHQKVSTYAVALSSPLPEIEIKVDEETTVTLVPFGKSVRWNSTINPALGSFQPTLTIVDFFVEEIAPDKTYGKFRINFEDMEQGADHDMDVIVLYEFWVQEDKTVKIKLTKEYQAAGILMHIGYIISGTTKDGIYLEVASKCNETQLYFLDTPMDRDEPGRGSSTMRLCGTLTDENEVYSRERTFTPSNDPAATLLKDPLWYSAKWGGDAEDREWDKDEDGIPDTYFYVINPLQLENELNRAFASILEKAASGTSASVLATTSRGEGNVLQAFFRPTIPNHDDVRWLGYLQNLWVDSMGNIREDTSGINGDGSYSLNIYEDKILLFENEEDGDTVVRKYEVSESNPFPDLLTSAYTEHSLGDITPIWEAGEKLLQRTASTRKIYTYIGDINTSPGDSVPFGSGTAIEFINSEENSNIDDIRPYLGVLCSDDENCEYNYLLCGGDEGSTEGNANLRAENLIEYIRGIDLDGLRPRRIEDGEDGAGVWKLGDIVNSSPAAVSRPPNKYHLIYGDTSYQEYYINNRDREMVVYVGANDGMLHAFTSWKYDYDLDKRYYIQPSGTTEDIGDEIWAYIPQSLLPHLKWLADPDYPHVYYVDQMPLVADAKIGPSGDEWRTLLIGGLRMGGKAMDVYEDFGDGPENKTFHPTYFCIDITYPRYPELLWERSYDNMGFSFSVPAIVREGNNWYLVFGSGPTDYDGTSSQKGRVFVVDLATGDPAGVQETNWVFEGDDFAYFTTPNSMDKDLIVDSGKFTHDHVYIGQSYLDEGSWKGKIYRMDIGEEDSSPNFWGFNSIFSIDGPITASLALSVDRSDNTWIFGGTGRYIEQDDKITTHDQYIFGFKDPLYNLGRGEDFSGELSLSDLYRVDRLKVTTSKYILDKDTNGVSTETETWNDLLGKTDVDYTDPANPQYGDGWYRELPRAGERCVTKPSIIGGLSLMPSFVPNDDICGFGGDSYFYSLYYKTGTAYYNPTIRTDGTYEDGDYEVVIDEIPIGFGMPASHLGLHVGEQEGATALIQLGTGGIIRIDVDTAFNIRSGILNWREN